MKSYLISFIVIIIVFFIIPNVSVTKAVVIINDDVEPIPKRVVREIGVEEKIRTEFKNDNPKHWVALGKAESRLQNISSKTDLMKDGRPFSSGIFMINLTVHNIGGLNCPNAFKGRNYKAVVINEKLYKQCIDAANDEDINIKKANSIFKSQGKKAWGAYLNGSYLKHLK